MESAGETALKASRAPPQTGHVFSENLAKAEIEKKRLQGTGHVGGTSKTAGWQDGKTVVAFDTNMLLNIARFKVDVFAEARGMLGQCEFVVPEQVNAELEKMAAKGLKLRKEVAIARELMAKNGVKTVKMRFSSADEALKNLALKAVVATNDKELKDSVRELGGRVLFLRQRKYLEMA